MLRRNPYFKVWAPAAQPDGYVDRIVQRFGARRRGRGHRRSSADKADWVVDDIPADRLPELLSAATRSQVHANELPAVWYIALNVNIQPFDELEARQAVNLAIDRNALVKLYGGPQLAAPTCQVLPPGFPGTRPYCPWTRGGTRALVGPGSRSARAS